MMTKNIQEVRKLVYEDRLKHFNLHSLEKRRFHGDLIEVNEWIKGVNKSIVNTIFVIKETVKTRSNSFKLDKFRSSEDLGKNWLTNRLADE